MIAGGGQEREMRAGTESVMGIVGFAAAVRDRVSKSTALGTRYPAAEAFVANLGSFAKFTIGEKAQVLPGHVHVQFEGVSAETLLIRLDREGVSASAGAACSSGSLDPSHVLLAAGLTEEEARQGVRFSFGPDQTPEVGAECARRVIAAVGAIRASRK